MELTYGGNKLESCQLYSMLFLGWFIAHCMMSTIRNVCERNGSVASAQFSGETSHTSKDSTCKRNLPKSTSNVIKLEKGKLKIFSIRAFVGLAGLVMCAQSALAIYSKSVLTSIEKRFEISSSLAGFIVGSFNIGNLLFVVLVSWMHFYLFQHNKATCSFKEKGIFLQTCMRNRFEEIELFLSSVYDRL